MTRGLDPSSPSLDASIDDGRLAQLVEDLPETAGHQTAVVDVDDETLCLLAAESGDPDEDWPRFAAVVARRMALSSDRLLPVLASGNDDGTLYVAFETRGAVPLSRYRETTDLTTQRCLGLMFGLSRALDDAAGEGTAAYAVTPDSVFVHPRHGALIADLGACREALGNPPAAVDRQAPWVAPEVLEGESAHPRSGVYAFGALTYTLLTGAPPGGEPITALRPDLPDALDAVLSVAMARTPHKRYGTAGEARHLVNLVIYGAGAHDKAPATRFPRRRAASPSAPAAAQPAAPKPARRPARPPARPTRRSPSDSPPAAADSQPPAKPAKRSARPAKRSAGPDERPARPAKRSAGPAKRSAGPAKRSAGAAKRSSRPAKRQARPANPSAPTPGPAGAAPKRAARTRAGAPTPASAAASAGSGRVVRGPTRPPTLEWPAPVQPPVLHQLLPAVLLAVALVVGAVTGAVLAGGSDDREPARPERVAADGLSVTLPEDWQPVRASGAQVAARATWNEEASLTVATDEAPVAVGEHTGPVKLGNLEAWRTRRPEGANVEVRYTIPTTSGKVVATCTAPAGGVGLLASCERAASTLELRSVKSVPLATVVEDQERWRLVAGRLQVDRRSALRRLGRALRPAGQSAAAEVLARVHRRAARRFAALPNGEASARAATRTADAYAELAAAARGGNAARWNAARADVRRSESELADAVTAS